jgi:surfeit locus 1 family protein
VRIFAALGFCFLVGLGVWQLQRLSWKENLIQQIHTQQELPMVDFSEALYSTYRRVYTVGTFDYDRELKLIGKTVDQKAGYYLFTPMKLTNGSVVFVNRGWVPASVQNVSRPSGLIRVEGIEKERMSENAFTPRNNYEKREIFTFNPQEIGTTYPGHTVLPMFIDATQISEQGEYPIVKPLPIHLRNNHLVYALTWFALALGLAIVCFIFIRNKRHRH